jgi:hypothetical protein
LEIFVEEVLAFDRPNIVEPRVIPGWKAEAAARIENP